MKIFSFFVAAVCTIAIQANSVFADQRPNIVLIFVDDLGYHDLQCYGSTFYETPRLDALATQSVRFTDFYSAHPVCSPTRAALMTGKTPQRVGIVDWIPQPSEIHLPHDETTVAEALQAAGYDTGYIGKWHLGEKDNQQPDSHGFNWHRCVNRAGQPASYFFPFKRKRGKGRGRKVQKSNYWNVPDLGDASDDAYLTDLLTDKAIEFVSHKRERPFFLCLSHYAVHTPIQSPKDLVEKYTKNPSQLPAGREILQEKNNSVTRPRQDDPRYAAMIENLDTNVGRLLDTIQQNEQNQNTIVIFTSDNGGLTTKPNRVGPTSVVPLRAGKGWCYEGGIKVPCLVHWPSKLEPAVCNTPAITMDLYPTLLEACGADPKPEQHLDGMSLVPAMQLQPSQQRCLGWHYPKRHGSGHRPSTAIRFGQHKAIHFIENDQWELYDLVADPEEQNNIATSEIETLRTMKDRLIKWRDETTDASRPD